MSDHDSRPPSERNKPEDSPGNEATRRQVIGLWTGILAGPALWFTHQQVSFVLVPWVCDHGGVMWLHAATAVLLVGTLAAGLLARKYWRAERVEMIQTPDPAARTSPAADDAPVPVSRTAEHQRVRFMAMLGMLSSVFFGLVIIAQELPNFFIDPCQR